MFYVLIKHLIVLANETTRFLEHRGRNPLSDKIWFDSVDDVGTLVIIIISLTHTTNRSS